MVLPDSRMKKTVVYLVGALKNQTIPELANRLEEATGFEVFADWFAPGPDADQYLREYSTRRGRGYKAALASTAAQHVFNYDKFHIDRADIGVMVMPAGKSGHLELGYMIGQGKPGYILFGGEPDRLDVMHNFATELFFSEEKLIARLKGL